MPEQAAGERTRQELEAIQPIVEEMTGLFSRWSGNVELVPNAPFRGSKPFHCDILLAEELAFDPLRWRTLIHELLHTVSAGYNFSDYNLYQGFEEGVVEAFQRLIRPRVLSRLGVSVEDAAFLQGDSDHAFNDYIEALEKVRTTLGQEPETFYRSLLRTPIRDRHAYLLRQVFALPTETRKAAIAVLSAARAVLEGKHP